jgi:hypothetical protein
MSATFTSDIAEISYKNNRYAKGWFITVINECGEWVSEQGVWFASKAEATAALKKNQPGATVMPKHLFRNLWLSRQYRSDHS